MTFSLGLLVMLAISPLLGLVMSAMLIALTLANRAHRQAIRRSEQEIKRLNDLKRQQEAWLQQHGSGGRDGA